jgi:hypothetical protein
MTGTNGAQAMPGNDGKSRRQGACRRQSTTTQTTQNTAVLLSSSRSTRNTANEQNEKKNIFVFVSSCLGRGAYY